MYSGPRLEVIDVAFFRFQATHGITVLEIGKSNPSILLFGYGYGPVNNSVRIDGKLHWVQHIEVKDLMEKKGQVETEVHTQ